MKNWKTVLFPLAFMGGVALSAPAQAAFIAYGVGVTDPGTPSSFSISFSTPVVGLTGIVSFSASVSGTLTDATGDGVSASPFGASIFEFLIDGTDVAVDALGTISGGGAFGPATFSGTFDCGAGCASLGANVHFTGSGNGDQYAFTGRIDVLPVAVPEPATLALLGLGLVGLGFSRRRKLN